LIIDGAKRSAWNGAHVRNGPLIQKQNPSNSHPKAIKSSKDPSSKPNHENGNLSAKAKGKRRELTLPGEDGDVEDEEIAWLEYMLKKEKKGDDLDDGLDGDCLCRYADIRSA
jgi:hypothetical protein